MAKRKRWQDDPEPDEVQSEDSTRPAIDESAMLAAHDQFEATKTGEANPPSIEAAPAEPPPDPVTPVEELSAIPLKVFAKVAGPKWDQMAGFLSYAKLNKMGPRTVPEWRAAYQAFLQKPVN